MATAPTIPIEQATNEIQNNPALSTTEKDNAKGQLTGMYGNTNVSQPVATSSSSRTNFTQNSADLDAAMAKLNGVPTNDNPTVDGSTTTTTDTSTSDPFIQGLTRLSQNSDAATKALIASTQAAYQNNVNKVTSQYANYKAGLQQLGVETGSAEATPDLLAGHIQQAANDEMAKINDLQVKESKTLIDAKNAKDKEDFTTLDKTMTYHKQLQTEKSTAIKNMYDSITNSVKLGEAQIDPTTAETMYKELMKLNGTDKTKLLQAIGEKYNMNPLTVIPTLVQIDNKQAKATKVSTNAGGVTKDYQQQVSQNLATQVDANDHVTSDIYKQAFKDWTVKGGSPKSFIDNFGTYADPNATDIPDSIKPKTTGTVTNPFG